MKPHQFTFCLAALWLFGALPLQAVSFVAYSLKAAERQMLAPASAGHDLARLGGITHLSGMIYDPQSDDWILVGVAAPNGPVITLDDFVVALRAVHLHQRPPLVSIDPPTTAADLQTGNYLVRFEGGIENTQLGLDALDCDILLKQIALGKVEAGIWGVPSYVTLRARSVQQNDHDRAVQSRFWFKNKRPSLALRAEEGIFALMDLGVGIETEVTFLHHNASAAQSSQPADARDSDGDTFAGLLEDSLPDLAVGFPILRKVRSILSLVSLAEGMRLMETGSNLDYWLRAFPVQTVATRTHVPRLETSLQLPELNRTLTVEGGLEINPVLVRLKRGHLSAFRQAVLQSRPSSDALVWSPPLDGWHVPGLDEVQPLDHPSPPSTAQPGFSLTSYTVSHPPGAQFNPGRVDSVVHRFRTRSLEAPPAPFKPVLPDFSRQATTFQPPAFSQQVGGVMLSGRAEVDGDIDGADLASGNFSLVLQGEGSRVDPATFRRFVTALWAVYYGDQDPGLSIDPIAPGLDQHLVRYIGNVINTDLGRVMRQADYLMKQWAVGTTRPDLPDFLNPDEIAGREGKVYVGAASRFWFVPRDLLFRRAGNLLLFEHGRMTVQTEILGSGNLRADPANAEFARYLTDNYERLARLHPVLDELFDYAKLVSLAKYLKDNQVPLHWFLLANLDQVLTEDSPGTVEALARGSDYFRNITIEGGVELSAQGQFVFDAAALEAISAAWANSSTRSTPAGPASAHVQMPPRQLTFELDQKFYSVLPQHSLTSGRDRRGIRYQTDFALRQDGHPGLELVRYFNPHRHHPSEFGQGWQLLIPFRIAPDGPDRIPFLNVMLPQRMTLEHRLSGHREILTFSTNRYSIAGYVPETLSDSRIVGLFLLANGSFRLADKLGNEFQFNPAGDLTDMILAKRAHLTFAYGTERIPWSHLNRPPFRLEPAGSQREEVLNVTFPQQLRLHNLVRGSESLFTLSRDHHSGTIGYLPADPATADHTFLAILTDGSFRLEDHAGGSVAFDRAGRFSSLTAPVVRSLTQGDRQIHFTYEFAGDRFRIGQADLLDPQADRPISTLTYHYANNGSLANVTQARVLADARQL